MKNIFLFVHLVLSVSAARSYAGTNPLQLAIAVCDVEKAKQLLKAGADPNAKDQMGQPVLRWLGSNQKCNDSAALATAQLLDESGADFQKGASSRPSLLVNIAHRGMPRTLKFMVQKPGAGDVTDALKAIARKGDIESVRVLLAAGADPLAGVANSSSLFDATTSGQTETVHEMLKHIKDVQSPKIRAGFEWADKKKNQQMAQIFVGAGFKPVASTTPIIKCPRQELTGAQTHLLDKAGLVGAKHCKFVAKCGDLILVDCDSAADGPAFYINDKTEKVEATCGGACMMGCENCPPKAWNCECKM